MSSSAISSDVFGVTSKGEQVDRFTLVNQNGVQIQIISLGGIITSIVTPDKKGNKEDITTGFDNVQDYEKNTAYFGAIIGRYANRIHKGKFSVDGENFTVAVNNGPNHLHGGLVGFDKKIWKCTVEGSQLHMNLTSADGEEGYPGEVKVTVVYELTNDNGLVIDYMATTSKPTPLNLTNHAYFNLAGHKSGNVYQHLASIFCDKFTPKNEDGVPSGEIAGVVGTLYDLRKATPLGDRIHGLTADKGFDINFCVDDPAENKLTAKVEHEDSGRVLEVFTNQPGVQLYTGNFLDNIPGKEGAVYGPHSAFCLETQNYPDAINKPEFPNAILRPGQIYKHTCCYKFSTKS